MTPLVLNAALEVLEAVLPVLALIFVFQLFVLRRVPPNLRTMLTGIGMAMLGFFLFILGAKISLIPMGMRIGEFMSAAHPAVIGMFAFVLGVTVIFAEPAVRIFGHEVENVSSGSLRKRLIVPTVALGVGLALVLAALRLTYALPLAYLLVPGYLLILALTLLTPRAFVPIAFDAGAVATGPVAVNFVLPLTTGMALALQGGDTGVFGFGVVGIIAMCPILFMLLLGIALSKGKPHG